ncbi:MAG: site-specific integrase [Sphingobacteriales bacterium]|nr:site-specific integrase [Sphingobacteriales bacterium]
MQTATSKAYINNIVNSKGESTVMIRVTYNRKKKYYKTNITCTPEAFKRATTAKRKTENDRELYFRIKAFEDRAEQVIQELPFFTFDGFAVKYIENRKAADTLTEIYEAKIKELTDNGKIGTATTYRNAINSLNEFKKDMALGNITAKKLQEYSKWMLNKQRSKNTISIYLRTLRAIFNEQIATKNINEDLYPFRRKKTEKRKYAPPAPVKRKRALTDAELSLLYYYEPKLTAQVKALDFWKLSYLCSGMNFTDILNLKVKDYDGQYIRFFRQKTEETDDPTEIVVYMGEDAKTIVNKYRVINLTPQAFLFPFLTKNTDAETHHNRVKSFICQTNKQLKKICKEIGIQYVSTYHARHSFANKLKQGGIGIEKIKEALGHASEKTTETYLKSFNDEVYKEIAAMVKPLKVVNQ